MHQAEEELNRLMMGGANDVDSSYIPLDASDVEAIFDLPTGSSPKALPFLRSQCISDLGVSVILRKFDAPMKTGTMGAAWTEDELSVLPPEHRSRLGEEDIAGTIPVEEEEGDSQQSCISSSFMI